jgi:cell division transport system permease protein
MIDRIEFALSEALTALRRNGMMTAAAITTCAIALFLFGGLGSAYVSLSSYLHALQYEIAIMVPLKPTTLRSEAEAMTRRIREIDGVQEARFAPKEAVWKEWTSQPGLEKWRTTANPLPDQIKVLLKDLNKGNTVIEKIKQMPEYDPKRRIRDASPERERVGFLIGFVRLFGGLLSVASLVTAGTLIFNTVYLTVIARRQQIQIMSLLGASRSTIRWPFLLEGVIQGCAGGLAAGLLLWGCAAYIGSRTRDFLSSNSPSVAGIGTGTLILFLIAVGALLGILSAGLSVRKHLRYEG